MHKRCEKRTKTQYERENAVQSVYSSHMMQKWRDDVVIDSRERERIIREKGQAC